MGSSGASRFSDYPESPRKKITSSGGRSGGSGGSSGTDQCDRAFSTDLEDFELSEYFKKHKASPKKGARITIIKDRRIVARVSTGESIGNLPTKFNYLATCMDNGYTYIGQITAINGTAVRKITIDAGPEQ